jgi:hypothetical protein
LIEGEKCEFNCIITGNPKPTITWTKTKASIQEDVDSGRIVLKPLEAENSYSLIIDKSLATDAGQFVIKAKNPIGEVSSTSQLAVLTPPKLVKPLALATSSAPVITSEVESGDVMISKISVNEKSQVRIECQIAGIPKPNIKWLKSEEEIKNGDKFKLENKQDTYALSIKDFSNKEKGLYKVVAENSVGTVMTQMFVDINNVPSFTKPLANMEIVFGETQKLELECTYQSKPKADVLWFIGDKQIKDGDEDQRFLVFDEAVVEDGIEINQTKLKIQNITLKDAGSYKCKLKNCAGEANTTCVLSILKAPVIVKQLPSVLDLNEKKDVKMECQIADSIPKSTITWHKDGNNLNASKRILIGKPVLDAETEASIYNLTIVEATGADSGVYTVKAANKVATVESTCNVNVFSAPKIIKDLKPTLECSQGDKVQLEVSATGKPIPEFKWYHFNTQTNSEEEVVSKDDVVNVRLQAENVYVIEFYQIQKLMEGKYTLKLSNNAGSVETSCNIIVNVPPSIVKQLENTSVSEGNECTLLVVVDGSPNPAIEWYKNDAKLKPDKRYATRAEEKTFYLTITDAKSADQGKYKAVAKNKAGQVDTQEAELLVTGNLNNFFFCFS